MTRIVVATRIHLDKATSPPTNLDALVLNLHQVCMACRQSRSTITTTNNNNDNGNDNVPWVQGVIAVDAGQCSSIVGGQYDLVDAVQTACHNLATTTTTDDTSTIQQPPFVVLPVQPWGKFVPALNALLSYAAKTTMSTQPLGDEENTTITTTRPNNDDSTLLLYCSAETTVTAHAISTLRYHMMNNNTIDHDSSSTNSTTTLVCGAVLPGHDYHPPDDATTTLPRKVVLNGRTSPWNTLALWNVQKLALTGFLQVSEGLLDDTTTSDCSMAGVEEAAAIAVLQRILGPDNAQAKLVRIGTEATLSDQSNGSAVAWNPIFTDPARQAWHETKMQSKLERAAKQLNLLGQLQGVVYHC